MHHSRRKSGHASANTSMTDVRKAATTSTSSDKPRRPQMSRKNTPQAGQKLGKSPRDREREWQEERWYEDDRESFPQYCMTCDKQFIPHDERIPYCSEVCRTHDQGGDPSSPSLSAYDNYYGSGTAGTANLPFYSADQPEPRDIIPRASPSRPSSTYWSPPTTPTTSAAHYTSAVSALKSLSIRPPSPPSPVSASSSIWPFARSAATSPSTSYTKPANMYYSSTYDAASTYGYGYGSTVADRPLPSRRPGGYSRPKSVELVTPMIGGR